MAINTANNIYNNYSAYDAQSAKTTKADTKKETAKEVATKNEASKGIAKQTEYGKTVGNAKLSDKAAKYYEKLKKKFNNLDFVLVSKDEKQNAQANAGKFANASKMVVLIDEEKIEKMATDEKFRKQYEGVIAKAYSGMNELKTSMESSGQSGQIKGYGMQIADDGTAKYFAVLKDSAKAQNDRIEKQAEKKAAAKKAEKAKAEKQSKEEMLKGTGVSADEGDTVLVADSVEELMKKISEYTYNAKSDSIQTSEEKQVGQSIDFRG